MACGIGRAANESRPIHPRRSDDGLCGECRDNNAPPIPDHDPTEHIRTRCDHIAATQPADIIRGLLRRDWRAARTLAERLAISSWIDSHSIPGTRTPQPVTPTDPIAQNPLIVHTDAQLPQHINDLELRITLADNDAILYGPAPHYQNNDAEYDNAVRHHTAQQAIRNARTAHDEFTAATRALQAITTELDTTSRSLTTTPAFNRGARRKLQTRITALATQHQTAIHTRDSARIADREAHRDATLHAGPADRWDQILATPHHERTDQSSYQPGTSHADADSRDQIIDYQHRINELRTEQHRRVRLTASQQVSKLELHAPSNAANDSTFELPNDPTSTQQDTDLGP
ncbi:hypothetical protein [Nocardia brasiliensis]|uniref:hypothetical protein n=1 Tax=Nocardia brasiliensis TaxID=37326 RepID=UPI00366D94D0